MSSQRTFRRKVIYVLAMAPLLGILYALSNPMTTKSPGGVLAQAREEAGLSETSLGEIDPTGETMKLATLGMRGVATNILWAKARGYQKTKDWTSLAATLNQISKLEPHFIAVWRNQAWNLSYNISAEFDDYRQRYRWVIRGIEFMMRGVKYNEREPRLYWDVAWFTAQKIGNADEKVQFRRMFREDDDFHEIQGTQSIENRDNWLVGKKWFGYSENLAKDGASLGGISEVVFFSHYPMCQMNYSASLEEEGIFGEKAKGHWAKALVEWTEHYGGYPVATSWADPDGEIIKIQLNNLQGFREEIDYLTKELEAIQPGKSDEIRRERWANMSDEELGAMHFALTQSSADRSTETLDVIALADSSQPNWREELLTKRQALLSEPENTAIDTVRSSRTNAQMGYFDAAAERLFGISQRAKLKLEVKPKDLARQIENSDDRGEALRLADDIEQKTNRVRMITSYRTVSNYEYWWRRALMEQTDEAQAARKAIYEGKQKLRKASLPEANEKYIEGLQKWSELLAKEEFQEIKQQQDTGEEIVIMINDYNTLLGRRDELFPEDFPLQDFVLGQIEGLSIAPVWGTRAHVADAKQTLATGDLEAAAAALEEATIGWSELLTEFGSLMRMSNRSVGDEILATIELHGELLAASDEVFPEGYPLQDFLHLQVEHTEQVVAARQIVAEAVLALEDSRTAEAQDACDRALAKWREVLDRFPSLLRDSDRATTAELAQVFRLYMEILQRRDKTLPEDFILQDFVDLHSIGA